MMERVNRTRSAVSVAVVIGLAACSGDPAPGPGSDQLDAANVRAGVAAIDRVVGTPAMASFRLVSGHLADIAAADAPVALLDSRDRVTQSIRRITSIVMPPSGASLVPLIRSTLYGKTFVYDLVQKKYLVDPARTGAPPNGVRFVLYEMAEGGATPKEPLQETGYSDLTDERVGAENTVGLRFRVVGHGVTYLDYEFGISGSIGSATFTVDGFLSNGTDRVNFDIEARSRLFGEGGNVDLDATVSVPSQDFSVRLDASSSGSVGPQSSRFDLTVIAGTTRVDVAATGTATAIDATVKVNGQVFATATGDPTNPVIRGTTGQELTAEEMEALAAIVGLAQGMFKLVADLLGPVWYLLLLGLGL